MVWYSHLFQNFPQFAVIHTVKGFGIFNKAEIDAFLELCCFFDNPTDVDNLISGPADYSKSNFIIWKSMVHILFKPSLENFECYFAIEHSFALPFFGIGVKTTFSSPVASVKFSKFTGILCEALKPCHLLGFEMAQLEFHHPH